MQPISQIINQDGTIKENTSLDLSKVKLLKIYRTMVLTRTLDTKMTSLQRQGRIGFYLSSLGEEAISVGTSMAMNDEDWFFPAYREQGAALIKGVTLTHIISHLMGNSNDEFKGRSLPGIFGSKKSKFIIPSAPVGTQIPHAVGAAFAAKLRGDKVATIVYFGDGATSSNDFHSGLNFAGVYNAPTVFICKNNQYAISTPFSKQTGAESVAIKAQSYGFEGIRVDGNDVLAVYLATKTAAEKARNGDGPVLIEALTYRLAPHSTSDDPTRYQNPDDRASWIKKDPISRFRVYLEKNNLWNTNDEQELQKTVEIEVNNAVKTSEQFSRPALKTLIEDVYSEIPESLLDDFTNLENHFSDTSSI